LSNKVFKIYIMNMKKLWISVFILFLSGVNCAYFNTFFNAKKAFSDAQKLSEKRESENISQQEKTLYDKSIEKASVILEKHRDSRWVDDAILLIGKSFYYQGEYNKAAIKFSELSENFPDSKLIPESIFYWGLVLMKLENYTMAEDKLRLAIDSGISDDLKNQAYMYMAELLLMRNDYEGAIREFRKNLAIVTDNDLKAQMQIRLGQCYLELEDYEKAKEEFRKVEDFDPSYKISFEGKFNYAITLRRQGDYENAIIILERLLKDQKIFEEFPRIELEIAHCITMQKDFEKAIERYKNIAEEYSGTAPASEALFNAGEINFKNLFDFEKAKELYTKANTQNVPEEIRLKTNGRLKDISSIIQLQKQIFKRDVKTVKPAGKNKNNEEKVKNDEEAEPKIPAQNHVKTKKEKENESENIFRFAEIFYEKVEAPDSAIFYLNKIVNDYEGVKVYPKSLFLLSHLHENYKNDKKKSKALLKRIVEEYPLSSYGIEAKKKLGLNVSVNDKENDPCEEKFKSAEDLVTNGQIDESAMSIYREIINNHPESEYAPKSLYTLGWIYENYMYDNSKALQEYEKLVEDYPDTKYSSIARKKLSVIDRSKLVDQSDRGQEIKNVVSLSQLSSKQNTDSEPKIVGGEEALKTVMKTSPMIARFRQQKVVKLKILIDKFGTGKEYNLLESSGNALVDTEIINTFKKFRFIPAMKGGKPQESWYEFEIKLPLIEVKDEEEPEIVR